MGMLIAAPIFAPAVLVLGSLWYNFRETQKKTGRWGPFFFEALPLPMIFLPVSVILVSGYDMGVPLVPPFLLGVIGAFMGLAGGSLGVSEIIGDARRGIRVTGWRSELVALPLALPLFLLATLVFYIAFKMGAALGASPALRASSLADPSVAVSPEQTRFFATFFGGEVSIISLFIFWALCVYVLAPKRPRDGSKANSSDGSALERFLDGAGRASISIGAGIDQLVAFVKAGLWGILAVFLIHLGWRLDGAIGWFVMALGVVAAGKGLSEIGPVLRSRARLENQSAHGAAATATEEQATAHERGDTSQTPLHRQRF